MKIKHLLIGALALSLFSCGGGNTENATSEETSELAGTIKIDGSSTVYPITAGVAEYFGEVNPKVEVLVGVSGTGGGFKKFAVGETDINDASRSIKDEEKATCETNKIAFQELAVAYDGLAVVVNKGNDWANDITVEELKKIWAEAPEKAILWSDVRATWPKEKITLYGPGTASGTYDYFNEEIIGKGVACRTDYNSSENDNVLIKGISDDKFALGYFGLAYYEENASTLKVLGVNGGSGVVIPSMETVMNKTYTPLSRKIFIYVSSVAVKKPEVVKFVDFYLDNTAKVSKEVGYIPLPEAEGAEQKKIFQEFASKQ